MSRAEDICGGHIGSGGRFCCKQKSECEIQSHKRKKFEDIKPGLYIKGQGEDAYTAPVVSKGMLGSDAVSFLLKQNFNSYQTSRSKIDLINDHDSFLQYDEDLRTLLDTKPSAGVFTPSKKRKFKRSDLKNKFDAALENVKKEGETMGVKGDPAKDPLGVYLRELTNAINETQGDLESAVENVHETMAQIGVPNDSCPPSLWTAYLDNKSDIADIAQSVNDKVGKIVESKVTNLEGFVSTIERRMNLLEANVTKAFGNVRDEFNLMRSAVQSASGGAALSTVTPSSVANLDTRLAVLEKSVVSFVNGHTQQVRAVRVGKFHFQSIDDVGAWVDKYLPPSYPFGRFVDAYSFLERVNSSRDVGDFNAVSDMDARKKVAVSTDEATVVDAFQHPLPRCFRGTGSHNSAGYLGSWLPGVKTKQAWENRTNTHGVKVVIKDSVEGIRGRIGSIISQRLSTDMKTGQSYDEANSLARELLIDTVNFINTLIEWISNTHKQLVDAGYPDDAAWSLVTKLVHRMFATDCYHDKRGIVNEMLDSNDHRLMAKNVLWATFATHQVMKSYLKASFSDHPSVSGEYTRFLIAHAGVAKVEKAISGVNTLNSLVASLEKKLETADKKATTAASKADEALKTAKKAKRDD